MWKHVLLSGIVLLVGIVTETEANSASMKANCVAYSHVLALNTADGSSLNFVLIIIGVIALCAVVGFIGDVGDRVSACWVVGFWYTQELLAALAGDRYRFHWFWSSENRKLPVRNSREVKFKNFEGQIGIGILHLLPAQCYWLSISFSAE